MAGIGFVLRKLMKKREISGVVLAYFHATLATCGPWLFTVAALGSFFILFKNWTPPSAVENFRAIILYNFSFSLVFSGPFIMITTRYLADCIYTKQLNNAPGLMLGALICLFAIALPIVSVFYLVYCNLPVVFALMAIANFLIIMGIWELSVFISAVKYYRSVTFSFLSGMVVAVLFASYLGSFFSSTGMLAGFNLGLSLILAILITLVFAEYPHTSQNLFGFLKYFKKYWELALSGLFYNLAIWIDKWIMWLAPEAQIMPNGLAMYPDYDSAMFAAYLTIIPGMAMFLVSQETAFYEVYLNYFRAIREHSNLKQIENTYRAIIDCVFQSGRNIILLQSAICTAAILLAPYVFELMDMDFIKLGIFRYGVLGSTFQIFLVFLTIFLSYFDYRKGVLLIQTIFLLTNASFTYISIQLGFSFFGMGYFFSTLTTFLVAAIIVERYLQKLPFHTFITNNTSVDK